MPQFASAIRNCGPCVIVLDDLANSVEQGGPGSIRETLSAVLDFCPAVVFVATTSPRGPVDRMKESVVCLGPLDAADTREYMTANSGASIRLESVADYDRVRRATGGLPAHIDTVIDAMAYTDLNGAVSTLDIATASQATDLPGIVVDAITRLSSASDDSSVRTYTLLTVLCILERGESLNVIKRIRPQSPLWPKHAKQLEELGLLDVMDASPQRFEPRGIRSSDDTEKILRVPRVVRDHVIGRIPQEEQMQLVAAAATVYFGSDWRNGSVRMRRRPAFSTLLSTHLFANEMLLLRMLITDRPRYLNVSRDCAVILALSYVSYLYEKGFYGEGYEAAREFLGLIGDDPEPLVVRSRSPN